MDICVYSDRKALFGPKLPTIYQDTFSTAKYNLSNYNGVLDQNKHKKGIKKEQELLTDCELDEEQRY